MATTFGQEGCLNADLKLAQSQGFELTIVHKDESGDAIDHTNDTGYCRLRRDGYDDVVLDEYVTCGEEVTLELPGSVTASIAEGTWKWDLFAGDVRLLYGKCKVYDTYARDTVDGGGNG